MWEINNALQVINLLYSAAFGIIICLIYDILRSLRCVFSFKNSTVFFQDILFFIILAITVFCFLIVTTNGQLRGYIIFGIILGFLICRFTFSKAFYFALKFIFYKIYSFLMIFKLKIIKISEKPLNLWKKTAFLFKKLLKKV